MEPKFLSPFTVDEESLTLRWSVPCQVIPHPLDKLCMRILHEGKGGREEGGSNRVETCSDDEDDFFAKNFVVGRRQSTIEVVKAEDESNEEKLANAGSGGVGMKGLKGGMLQSGQATGGSKEDASREEEEEEEWDRSEEEGPPLDTLEDIQMLRLQKRKPKTIDLGMECYRDATDISPEHLFGPTLPNVKKLLTVSKTSPETVRESLCLSADEWAQVVEGENEGLNVWGPVLAQVAVLSQRPLVRILRKEDPSERMGWGSKGEDGAWHITTLSSVGMTSRRALEEAGTLDEASQRLLTGWVQWRGRSLIKSEMEAFFRGESEGAEKTAGMLLKLANATNSKLLFAMFTRY